MNQVCLRNKIVEQLDLMYSRCDGYGKNPFTVNVITFSGHGLTYINGDAIAAIPEFPTKDKKNKVVRFINFTDLARKFAERKKTLTIFILSMCRIFLDE